MNEEIKAINKSYEILKQEFRFDKYKRQLLNEPQWKHYKFYKTERAAEMALKDIRVGFNCYFDYPSMGNLANEIIYPHIKPTITITRYRVSKRITL